MVYVQIVDDYGEAFELECEQATFKTGSTGFQAHGKHAINGSPHTVSVILVLIGSKPR